MSRTYEDLFILDGTTYGISGDQETMKIENSEDIYYLDIAFFKELQQLMITSPFFWENANTSGTPEKMTKITSIQDRQDPMTVAEIQQVILKKPTEGKDVFVIVVGGEDKMRTLTSEVFLYVFLRVSNIINGNPDLVTK